MKKIISILSILLFFTVTNFAQTTVSISDTTSADSTEITIPVNVSGALDSVGSLSIFISYDKSVLDYEGIVDNPFAGSNFIVNDNNGVISVSWFSLSPIDITNKLFSIKFFYKGGSSNFEFTGTNQITDSSIPPIPFNINFVNGSIGALPATMSLGSVSGYAGDTVMVSYSGTNLKDLGSITTFIDYDTAAVKYVGLASETVDFQDNATAGQVGLAWFDTTPFTLNSGDLAVLKFVVVADSTDLTFNAQSQVTDLNGNALSITYTKGKISEIKHPEEMPTFSLGSVKGTEGFNVSVPLNFSKIAGLTSFTINVAYDTSVIHYVKYDSSSLVSGTLVGKETNGVLKLAWFDTTPLNLDSGKFADLVFAYKNGTTALTMTAVQITDSTNNDISSSIILKSGEVSWNLVKISQVQKPAAGDATGDSPYNGQKVTVKGIVTANYVKGDTTNTAYFVQEGSGAWNGIYVYDTHFIPTVGDSVTVSGTVDEYYHYTEINKVDTLIVVTSGNSLPDPVTITAAEFNQEDYEGVYVYVVNLKAISEADSHGEATFNDGTDDLITDDLLYAFNPTVGYIYEIKGVGYYSFSKYKLLPFSADQITDVNDNGDAAIPGKYSLHQNYPNPFNPSTVISFALKENSKVTLSIYNMLGQKITTLLNKHLSSGFKTVKFDASNLSSGIYLYRLQATGDNGASFMNTKKMILMK